MISTSARLIAAGAFMVLASTTAAGAQEISSRLEGTVTLRGAGTAVSGATVAIEGTPLVARTDSLGRYTLLRVPAGPQVAVVRRLGYAATRVPFTMPPSGSRTLDVLMAVSALQLDQLRVTADLTGRARGELGTASVIDRDAIANQAATSLQGILELVPGTVIAPPGLDGPSQFSLRALAAAPGGAAGAVSGPSASDIGAAGTLIILDGVPLSNNANLQSTGIRGEVRPAASTAGGGVDLRRIPASTLERVEVIRGVPSARWGDLTQGAIIVDTRAAASAPEFASRFDPRTSEANIVGGRGFATRTQALTLTANLAQTALTRTLSNATTLRGAAQLAHRVQFGEAGDGRLAPDGRTPLPRLSFDTRLDWFQLKYDSPERPDIEVGRVSFQDDRGFRVAERARLALGGGLLEVTSAFDGQAQTARESRRLARPTTPFTDRLTEGRNIGAYAEGVYLAAYEILGAPRLFYNRIEWSRGDVGSLSGARFAELRGGIELRREWNAGEGYQFAIDKPPQTGTFNGVRGYDRPRRFDDAPPIATSAIYVDARVRGRVLGMDAELQPGLRGDVLHAGGWWGSGSRSAMLQPRVNAQISPAAWVRVRGGIGAVSKLPTVAQLFPAQQYFDLVNVNRFTPDPRERLAVITTFIRDPSTRDLGLSRGLKREISLEIDGGARRGSASLTAFSDRIRGAVTLRRDLDALPRARYALADTGIGTGQPGRIIDPPIGFDTIPIFLDRFVNGGRVDTRGLELVMSLPVIPALRTRVEVGGASIETAFASDERDFGPGSRTTAFQLDSNVLRIPYFDGGSTKSWRNILTWRVVHHQPDVGLVITATIQQRLGDRRRATAANDSLSFEGYVTRTGTLVPVLRADRSRPEFADLRAARAGNSSFGSRVPNDALLSLQVAKSVAGNGRISFYVFNALDRSITFGNGGVRALPATRFGAELTIPTDRWFGAAR